VLTREIRSQINRIWDAFWSGGISNPLEVSRHRRLDNPVAGESSACRMQQVRQD
jgi:hypothetical protein